MQESLINIYSFSQEPSKYEGSEIFKHTPGNYWKHPEFGMKPFNAKCEDCFELLHKRTVDSRIFYKKGTGGTEFFSQKFYGAAHYEDISGQWKTIDPRIKRDLLNPEKYTALNQPIPVTINLGQNLTSLKLLDGTDLIFNSEIELSVEDSEGKTLKKGLKGNVAKHTAGDDGVMSFGVWKGIDRLCEVQRSAIKTSYIINDKSSVPTGEGYLVFRETIIAAPGMKLQKKQGSGIELENKGWYGKLNLVNNRGKEMAYIGKPVVFDMSEHPEQDHSFPIFYQITLNKDQYFIDIKVSLKWLNSPNRNYPVTVDPIVQGSNRYNAGYMGFMFDPVCFDTSNYCFYPLTVTVPGKSTLVGAWFDARYNSKNSGCGIGTLCRKKDAAFQIVGPCNTSPRIAGFWTCDSNNIISTIPGLCYGDSIPMFGPVSCIPPSCPDHVLDFEMRTFHCSCILPACDTACHIMRTGTWNITIAARTLEGELWQDDIICEGVTKGLQGRGYFGVPPYTFNWSPGGQTTPTISVTPLNTTIYGLTITDQCNETVTDSGTLTVRPKPSLSLSMTNAFCSNSADGSATAIGSGTTGPYTYRWNTQPMQTGANAVNLVPGNYTVSVTDVFGCVHNDSIDVGFLNFLDIGATVEDISCFGWQDGSILITPNGSAPYVYAWSNSANVAQLNNLNSGKYTVTVTDSKGCWDTASYYIIEPPDFSVDAGIDQTVTSGTPVTLNPTVNPSGSYIYLWYPSTYLTDTSLINPSSIPDQTITYYIKVLRPGNPDCFEIDSITIIVVPEVNIYVPSAFTPNGDGKNDDFYPSGDAEIEMIQIFNRWGEMVYTGNTPWDGKSGGVNLPLGTYVYIIRAKSPYLEEYFDLKGNVTLLR